MNEDNTMNILIASDLHLGFKENDPIRGNDSFDALREILQIAKTKKVDFILLGGDLFHLNKPSKNTLYTTLDLFQHFCLGKRPSNVKILSEPDENFGKRIASDTDFSVNYENPNINISMPVFSIHGNHDDNTGINELSSIDILSVAGLLNHFGKQKSANEFNISPVILRKGTTTLALYGLGSIRDVRLYKLFEGNKVTFRRYKNQNEWFNMFVLHQNRAEYNEKSYVPEKFLEDFFDLIIWGHEHECKIEPEQSRVKNFKIMQPGSTVATQMHKSECKPKHVAILRLTGRNMDVKKIPLRTVRPMYIETVVLSKEIGKKQMSEKATEESVKRYCRRRIQTLLKEAEQNHEQPNKLPLIQLKIDCSGGFDIFNRYRFGDEFKNDVANPESVVHFLKRTLTNSADGASDGFGMDVENISLEELVRNYLQEKEKHLRLLNVHDMSAAVDDFVNKDAIVNATEKQIDKTKEDLKSSYTGRLDRNQIVEFICSKNGVDPNLDTIQQSAQSSASSGQTAARPTTSRLTHPTVTRPKSSFQSKKAILVGTARVLDPGAKQPFSFLSATNSRTLDSNPLDTPDISGLTQTEPDFDAASDGYVMECNDNDDVIDLTEDDDDAQEPPWKRFKD